MFLCHVRYIAKMLVVPPIFLAVSLTGQLISGRDVGPGTGESHPPGGGGVWYP